MNGLLGEGRERDEREVSHDQATLSGFLSMKLNSTDLFYSPVDHESNPAAHSSKYAWLFDK